MVILDTNYLSILEWPDSPSARKLSERLRQLPTEAIATTVISYEEQSRGWLAAIAREKQVRDQIQKYREYLQSLEQYCSMTVLEFDERAAIEFQHLKKSKLRVGTMDLKIAAIALAQDALLLTQNLQHFQHIPGLRVEDWTKDEAPE